ncbi:hypothetical protein LTR48_003940 [Friedmanniomyces endolithicus]|uniref:DUF1770-domain-containing protein n=1 Tax=Rachicladosporium monterosium TaxID=1507873 RepID=A0ABR0L6X8_9PEZI|nr:hypothetical protein LTR29_010781 [Friedmanniomyces endolithicus]KAK1092637.1 hypothetical protein LTR48_003940 [Friedmanniomyces endolithicus]KAK1809059.1 hypothetical protein LTR12_016575 [Friedmanniomyces endolithicus]KAK5144432.1 hypothetical protein LTR32_003652 [Rachicladosporium monterosium]
MPDLQDAAIQFAETIQTAHINKHPSTQDIAPSTATDSKQRVQIDDTVDLDDVSEVGEGEIPVSLLRPTPRKPVMPPLPDLRFEQSYLASIKDAKGWQGVTFITLRDQLMMPLVQGMAWTLIVSGWRHWNASTTFTGRTAGAKIRRWWWGVNNWTIPDTS